MTSDKSLVGFAATLNVALFVGIADFEGSGLSSSAVLIRRGFVVKLYGTQFPLHFCPVVSHFVFPIEIK